MHVQLNNLAGHMKISIEDISLQKHPHSPRHLFRLLYSSQETLSWHQEQTFKTPGWVYNASQKRHIVPTTLKD
jgi:hypothetical protein